jgi:hypothetical protein
MKKLTNTILNGFLTFVIISSTLLTVLISPNSVSAQDTSEETLNQILDQIDDERIKNLELQLLLSLPLITENPNYILTFTDPSPSQKGIFFQIDGKEYKQITSPYTLPTLGIGKHILNFRFYDKVETQQILERDLVVVPRAPQINPPAVNGGNVTISGTSIAASQVEVLVFNEASRYTFTATSDASGVWSATIDKTLEAGKYTVLATTRKNGFSSKYSETMGFEVGGQTGTTATTTTENKSIYFRFDSLDFNNLLPTFTQNGDLAILIVLAFGFGLLIPIIWTLSFRNKETKQAEKLLKSVFLPKQGQTTQNVRQILMENLAKNEKATKEKVEAANNVLTNSAPSEPEVEEPKEKEVESAESVKSSIINADLLNDLIITKEEEDEIASSTELAPNIKNQASKKDEEEKVEEKKDKKTETKDTVTELAETIDEKEIETEEEAEVKTTEKIEVVEPKEDMKSSKKSTKDVVKEEGILSKEDFLMKFHEFDPDDEKGVEKLVETMEETENEVLETSASEMLNKVDTKPVPKEKRNIRISLTSKD